MTGTVSRASRTRPWDWSRFCTQTQNKPGSWNVWMWLPGSLWPSPLCFEKDRDAFLSCELSNIIMFYISQYLIYSKFWKTSCTYMYIVTFLVSNWRPSWIFFVSFSLFLLRYFSYKFCASDFSETTWSFLMKFLHYFSKRLGLLELILCTNIRIPFMYYSTSYILLSKQGIHPPFPKSAALASSLEKEPQRFSYSLIIV